jgi:hypothetical protein
MEKKTECGLITNTPSSCEENMPRYSEQLQKLVDEGLITNHQKYLVLSNITNGFDVSINYTEKRGGAKCAEIKISLRRNHM